MVAICAQVFLEFDAPFWEDTLAAETGQWGITLDESATERGMGSNIWNFKPFTDAPILCALVTGSSAVAMEDMSDEDIVHHALGVLCKLFGNACTPPKHTAVARWGQEEFSRGSYSFVGVGGSGDDYDMLARPIARRVLFCGEHTTKEHLDTVGGAIRTGVREVRHHTTSVSIVLDSNDGVSTPGHQVGRMGEGGADASNATVIHDYQSAKSP
jgi:monoamine oxidase